MILCIILIYIHSPHKFGRLVYILLHLVFQNRLWNNAMKCTITTSIYSIIQVHTHHEKSTSDRMVSLFVTKSNLGSITFSTNNTNGFNKRLIIGDNWIAKSALCKSWSQSPYNPWKFWRINEKIWKNSRWYYSSVLLNASKLLLVN